MRVSSDSAEEGSEKNTQKSVVFDVPAETQASRDEAYGLPTNLTFATYDAFLIVLSMSSYLLDIGSDIWLAQRFYALEKYNFFGMTIGVVIFTSLLITFLSSVWYISDGSHDRMSPAQWQLRILILLCQLAPVLRHAHALECGLHFQALLRKRGLRNSVSIEEATEEEKEVHDHMVKQNADASLLRLVEAFVEAGPQMILQFYIFFRHGNTYGSDNPNLVTVQLGSMVTSVISMAWAMAAYRRSSKLAVLTKQNISLKGTLVLFCWHLCIIRELDHVELSCLFVQQGDVRLRGRQLSRRGKAVIPPDVIAARVLALGLFASAFVWWVFVVASTHVGIIWGWAFFTNTTACDHRFKESFNILIAIINIFEYLNINSKPTRKHYTLFYILVFSENSTLVIMWFMNTIHSQMWYKIPALVVHFVTFALGIAFMLVYYFFFHPTKIFWLDVLSKSMSCHHSAHGSESSSGSTPSLNGVVPDGDAEPNCHSKLMEKSSDNGYSPNVMFKDSVCDSLKASDNHTDASSTPNTSYPLSISNYTCEDFAPEKQGYSPQPVSPCRLSRLGDLIFGDLFSYEGLLLTAGTP
ncbi:unnamed protein product [Darwinula stevensoni]|uniref:XK-related protein n=1 Tax=Darwinula stevensoni TaxID=69355 RepID=A0A7R9A7W0_9CRUS|nr:unnamed protein product [Darwinula stevensoni]CAG0893728.1 unnamed protein product [Darwinula stevensoni]